MRDKLRVLPYFAEVSDALLNRVAELAAEVGFNDGAVIIEEGTRSEEMYVVLSGELIVTKRSDDRDIELGRIGPDNVFGEIALLDQAPRSATVTAHGPTRVVRIPAEAFEELLADPHVVRRMFRTVTTRLRGIEDTLRHEERMAALGRMAAQLMHELNNPAAAVARSTRELSRIQVELAAEGRSLGAHLEIPNLIAPEPSGERPGALERGALEESMASWLEGEGVAEPWDLAPSLVAAGWSTETLRDATDGVAPGARASLLRWVGLNAASDELVEELGIGAQRISELVRVVKEYSFLDRAPIQEIDLTRGIEDTLVLMRRKLADIEVTLELADDLATVEASGRDLNQVWTNLIDNAADAMDGSGSLSITGRNEGNDVVITVTDTGPGIPEEKVDQVFDPFFTTKEPGKGTGLGLHTVHNIVGRAGGRVSVDTDTSGATFEVRLPAVR